MFSFHKPKVYRSVQGCCICKAKSSSSRFTDSKKYEDDFDECFQLEEPRQGEICNACVLLVKRFKRLPPGTVRHWSHVVDARIGPGSKSMTKFKKRKEEQMLMQNGSTEFAGQSNNNAQNIRNNTTIERFGKIFRKKKKTRTSKNSDENIKPISSMSSSSDNDDNRMDCDYASDRLECDEEMIPDDAMRKSKRKQKCPVKNRNQALTQQKTIDSSAWTQSQTCCGFIYESKKFGMVMIDADQKKTEMCLIHGKKVPSVKEIKMEVSEMQSVIKTLPRKKQLLRECVIQNVSMEQSAPIDYSKSTSNYNVSQHILTNGDTESKNLHKILGDSGKVTKKPIRKKISDLSAVKNLVKLCTNKLAKAENTVTNGADNTYAKLNNTNENANITNTTQAEPIVLNKYSDNSSDSGYDETLHDTTQLKQIAQTGAVHPVILSNGVKILVKPENLLLAANLAGVSTTTIENTQASLIAMNQKYKKPQISTVGELSNKSIYMITPSVSLTVTNNN